MFILTENMLSHLLNRTLDDTQIGQHLYPQGCPLVPHLLYAKDILLIMNGDRRSLQKILETLATYEKWSGQTINKEKSAIFMSTHISKTQRRELIRFIGFSAGKFPVAYLGAPLWPGRMIAQMLEPLVQKICYKVANWKGRFLSQKSCLILIHHVLS